MLVRTLSHLRTIPLTKRIESQTLTIGYRNETILLHATDYHEGCGNLHSSHAEAIAIIAVSFPPFPFRSCFRLEPLMSIDIRPETEIESQRETRRETQKSRPSGSGAWKWLLGLLVLGGLAFGATKLTPGMGSPDSKNMVTHEVQEGDLVVSITEQGKLESSQNVEIKCRVKGGSTVLWVIESGTVVQPGDELVRLDTSTIEDNISTQKITYETALANKATAESDVAVARIGIEEYLEGTFRSLQTTAKKDVVIAESNLKSAKNALEHAEKMFRKGYSSKLDLEAQRDAVEHAQLELDVKKTDLDALEKFTKAKELETLNGLLKIAEARNAAEGASLELEAARLKRAEDQLKNCVILAEREGLVLYPNAAEWKEQPDIEEGASVREDQVLLIMPNLNDMQVKVGIHESKVDRLRVGMPCRVQLQDGYVDGQVSEIASISKGGGWWNGNMVNYDTVVKVNEDSNLKPGMSVSVEVFLAKHKDVLTVPVAAVLELDEKFYCWVDNGTNTPTKQEVQVGDSNDTYIIIKEGVSAGDQIVLNPRDYVDEASVESLKPIDEKAAPEDVPEFDASKAKGRKKPEASGKDGGKKPDAKAMAAGILKNADKNKDGGLSEDEVDDNGRKDFKKNDTNGDGKLDAKELEAAIKKAIAAAGAKKK